MDEFVYIRFKKPKGVSPPQSGQLIRTIENAVVKILSTIIPKANPDFEHLLEKVDYWKIEFNNDENVTWREIGFDKDGVSIVAMPLAKNYGYWTDNHLTLSDYENFDSTPLTVDEFKNDWTEFEKINK